jgi:lysozyme family protein
MAMFELAIPIVLRHEGGFANVVGDPGGLTNYGVSIRWLRAQGLLAQLEQEEGDVNQSDYQAIKDMSQQDAEGFYRTYWWDKYDYTAVAPQAVATKIFDTAVNVGASRAHKFVQQAVGTTQDGVLGAQTLAKVNAANSVLLLATLQTTQAMFYKSLVAADPSRQKFLAGWLNRAFDRN